MSVIEIKLVEKRPLLNGGVPLWNAHTNLVNQLKMRFNSAEYLELLPTPVFSNGVIRYISDYVSEKALPINEIPFEEREKLRPQLEKILSDVRKFAKELKSQGNPWGDSLIDAIQVPSWEYVLVENNRFVLIWGLLDDKISKQTEGKLFLIEKNIQEPIPPLPDKPPVEQKVESKFETVSKKEEVVPQKQENNIVTPPPPVEKDGFKMRTWMWFVLGVIAASIIAILLYYCLLKQRNYLPPKADILPPIDTTQKGHDPKDSTKRVILTNKLNVALKKEANVEKFSIDLNEKFKDSVEIVFYDTIIKLLQIKTPPGEWKTWKPKLKAMSDVRLVFDDALFRRSDKPTDPGFSREQESWYFEKIKAFDAWNVTKGDAKIVVAIIDNGFDLNQPEFAGKIVSPWNVTKYSADVAPPRVQGGDHGTHVAGSAVGLMNNGKGVCGIAPECKLMPIQVADENGNMSSLSIVAGILYAIHKGANVMNLSLGMYFGEEVKRMSEEQQRNIIRSSTPSDETVFWDELYQFANENKVVVVKAAGNENILADLDLMSRSNRIICVTAVSPDLKKAPFSNFGTASTIAAPGMFIFSSLPNGNFGMMQGTSMASPIVAGAVALYLSKFPKTSPDSVKLALVASGEKISFEKEMGPFLQLDKFLSSALNIPDSATNVCFAAGKWKSSNNLRNDKTGKSIMLFFEFDCSGKGKITLVEDNGNKCSADLQAKYEGGLLKFEQKDKTLCEDNTFYRPYKFECKRGENGVAKCKAKNKETNADVVDFELYRQ